MKRISAVLVLLLLACGPGRTVVVNGRQVPYEEAAQSDFQLAKAALDDGKYDLAAQRFSAFVQRYKDSQLVDEALFRRAQALTKAGRLQESQAALQDFLEKHPTSPFKNSAALELAAVQSKLGQAGPPPAQLDTSQLSEKEKNQAAAALAESYARSGQPGEAMRWAARALESAPAEEHDARLKDFERALDAAPGRDVARLVSDLDRKSPAWPAAALKLARIQLHLGDRSHARDLASDILSAAGQGPYADGARGVLKAAQEPGPLNPRLLGIVLPLTGDLKGFADQALNGIALTLDLQGRGSLMVDVVDTKGEPDAAADAVDQLAQRGAIAILGPLGIAEGLAAATRAQQLGIPLLSLSRAEGLTALGEYVFRDMPTSSAQARAVAEYAQRKLNAKSFGILHPDSTYGDEMARYFWDAVDAGGSEVRAFEHYPLRTTTFKPFVQHMVGRSPADLEERQQFSDEVEKIMKEIKDPYRRRKAVNQLRNQQAPVVDFDAMFIPDSARTVRLIAPAIAAEDVITTGCDTKELEVVKRTTKNEQLRTVQLLGTSLWDSPDLVDERSGVARYVQCSIFVDVFFANSERPATKKFVDDFNSAYRRSPGFLEAHAFDAATILKRVLDERRPQSRDDLRAALANLSKPFEGAAGDTVFGKDREAQKPFFWLWINRGNIVEFDPEGPPPVPPASPLADSSKGAKSR
jgi:ABC-type branched-subunit amino acid transport system substrate-binding protein/predicted negative regulator of RcsB-dependent stress response